MRCRLKILRTILSQEIGFHDDPQNTPGQLAKALEIYSYRAQRLALAIGDGSDAICTLLCGLCIAFYHCWQLTLFALAFIPLLGASQAIQQKLVMGSAAEENATIKKSGQVLQDSLTNAKTVHANGNEKELVLLYKQTISHIHDKMTSRHLKAGIMVGFSFGFIMWFIAGTFYFMAFLMNEGIATFEDAFGAFMGLIYASMMSASAFGLTGDLGKAKVAAHDMFQLLDRKSQIDGLCPTGGKPDSEGFEVGHFVFENVCFHYPFRPDVQVLNKMSFTIAAGSSVGVVGPSGGGKSTVMAMIQRFYDPQEGEVYIGGKNNRVPLRNVDIRWWRRQVGFVGQEPILFQGTVLENVMYGIEEDEVITDALLEKCKQDAFLTFLDGDTAHGWQTEVGPRGSRLSGGQKQRVAICRALIRNPRIMLLDEATSALDSASEGVVTRSLELARKGRTSFAIAHRLSSIQDCDVIIVVADGKIVEQGSHGELIGKEGVYHKLHQSNGH
jgi:ATP-binding cassette subfamily B (MDR/TAP) protein 1